MPRRLLTRSALMLAVCLVAVGCDRRFGSVTACLSPATLENGDEQTTGQTSLTLHGDHGVGRVWLHELAIHGQDGSTRLASQIDPVFPIDTGARDVITEFGFVIEPRITTSQGLVLQAVLYVEENDLGRESQFGDGFMQLEAQDEDCNATP